MEDSSCHPIVRALIVDDNDANRAFAVAALQDEDFEVEAVPSARAAVARFPVWRPSCVLLDVKMPDKDGFAACAELRALPGGCSTAIVFLTAARSAETFERAVAAGADDFISKPVMANELVARVCAAVRAKALSTSVATLHSAFARYRMDLARCDRTLALEAVVSSASQGLAELSEYLDRMLELTGDLARGALEEAISNQRRPLPHVHPAAARSVRWG